MDVDSGEILYAKGIDEKRYPASTTKIMTAWLAIENSNLSDQITFSTDAVYSIEPGSTHIGIKPGEILTMEQSLYAVLLASANEVSNGVAEYVGGGSISAFVDKMNERAASLGCNNTHFMNQAVCTMTIIIQPHVTWLQLPVPLSKTKFSEKSLEQNII